MRRLHANFGHPQNKILIRHLRHRHVSKQDLEAAKQIECLACDAAKFLDVARQSSPTDVRPAPKSVAMNVKELLGWVLCFMFYVLCFMFYVLCFMFYVSCFVFRVSCFVFRVSCFVFRVSCFVFVFMCKCKCTGVSRCYVGIALIRRATLSSFRTTKFFYGVAFRSSLGAFFWYVKKVYL